MLPTLFRPDVYCGTSFAMARQSVVPKKKRGPPATGKGTQVQVRLRPDLIEKIDALRAEQSPVPSRPEAIRQILEATFRLMGEDT